MPTIPANAEPTISTTNKETSSFSRTPPEEDPNSSSKEPDPETKEKTVKRSESIQTCNCH